MESLVAGSVLGPYRIEGLLGVGGMGRVYSARDTRLDRPVAIKVSDDRFTETFAREARAIAALNHPNVCTLYDVGPNYLVMELIGGPTLADRLAAGRIPPDEALAIAAQIADALEAAHGRNIVHRDLKPANVKITPDGVVKVIDFGIAKMQSQVPAKDATAINGPTETGAVIGTTGYMAPEQIRGEPIDPRADIWAFGCVLYEMLTGRSAFAADDASTTLARVLERDPDLSALPRGLAPSVSGTIGLCLRKQARNRIADIRDVKLALDGGLQTSPRPRQTRAGWVAAGLATVAAVLLATGLYVESRPTAVHPLHLSLTLPPGWTLATSSNVGEPTSLAVSPDGQHVAIVAQRANGPATILIRDVESSTARVLPGTDGVTSMFWSPDSRSIGFFADAKLKTVEASSGLPTVVCDAAPPILGGTWGRDGTIVFSMRDAGEFRLWKVAANGGSPSDALPEPVAAQAPRGNEFRPWFLPDGRTLLYVTGIKDRLAVYAAALGSADRQRVTETDSSNVQYAEGRLLFLRGTTLVAQSFDRKRLVVAGDAVPIAEQVLRQGAIPGSGLFSASQNGVLVYAPATAGSSSTRLAWMDRRGRILSTVGQPVEYNGVALSHDETRAVATVGATMDLYIVDMSNGVSTQLTFDTPAFFPIWSPDDRFISFDALLNGLPTTYRKPSNGAGAAERSLPDEPSVNIAFDQSRNGALLYGVPGALIAPNIGNVDLKVLPDGGTQPPFRLDANSDDKRLAKFSPDARWVAYVSNSVRGQTVWVVPFLGKTGDTGAKWRASGDDGGTLPLWSADGHELFYISASGTIVAVQVQSDGEALRLGPSQTLFRIGMPQRQGGYTAWPYAVSRDGRFLVVADAETTSTAATEPLEIEVNWTARLER